MITTSLGELIDILSKTLLLAVSAVTIVLNVKPFLDASYVNMKNAAASTHLYNLIKSVFKAEASDSFSRWIAMKENAAVSIANRVARSNGLNTGM